MVNDLAVVHVNGIFTDWITWGQGNISNEDYCTIIGFGDNGRGKAGHLGLLKINLTPHRLCRVISATDNTVCSLQFNGVGPCPGDSGGPLMCNGALAGVISRGMAVPVPKKCGATGFVVAVYENIFLNKEFIEQALHRWSLSYSFKSDAISSFSFNFICILFSFCHYFHLSFIQFK